jgi:hypothetical protein
MGLKSLRRTVGLRKSRAKMFRGLQQRIRLGTGWRGTNSAQEGANKVQALAQEMNNPVKSATAERQTQLWHRRIDRLTFQQQPKQLPQERGADRETREDISQEYGKSAAAAPTLAAITAKDALAPEAFSVGQTGIIAVKKTVAIERLGTMTERASALFERQKPELQSQHIGGETK